MWVIDQKRQGEIALLLVKQLFRDTGLPTTPDRKKDLARVAKKIGVPQDELKAFLDPIFREILDEA